jgi:arylsulfatase A-like enzyme
VSRLVDYGILDNTYIIYTSDNGYHIGQHRLQPGKECGFEEDINIPLVIRGPDVPAGAVTDVVTSHTDLAPTIFKLIGKRPRDDFDGVAIPVTEAELEIAEQTRHEHVNVEYWGFALAEGKYGKEVYWNNTYKSLRIIGKGYNLYYSVWCNNEHELYDLNVRSPMLASRPSLIPSPTPERSLPTNKPLSISLLLHILSLQISRLPLK